MSWLLSLPILIPFAAAVVSFLLKDGPGGRWASVIGSGAMLASAIALMASVLDQGVIAGQMGNWPAPFGITLVADLLAAVMVLITAIEDRNQRASVDQNHLRRRPRRRARRVSAI